MTLKNQGNCCEITSDCQIEANQLLQWSMRSYSPRAAGLTRSGSQLLILNESEAAEFVAGVLRDIDGNKHDRWAITKIIGEWLTGAATDEVYA